MIKDSLKNFLTVTPSQKEVSLVIVNSETALADARHELERSNFLESTSGLALAKVVASGAKTFFILRRNATKPFYDFLVQYPTGQVELFDSEAFRPQVFHPRYDETAVIALVTKQDLIALEEHGMPIRSAVGLTYQR